MKIKDRNKLINMVIFDKKLGSPHMRILLLIASTQKKEWTVREMAEKLDMLPQQINPAINKLINWGYVEIVRKMESGRVLFYTINENCLREEVGQLTLDDISMNN